MLLNFESFDKGIFHIFKEVPQYDGNKLGTASLYQVFV